MTQPQQQRQQPEMTPAERVAQINRTLDTLDENMFSLLRDVNDYAEIHGWGDKTVKRGLDQIHVMERRIAELEEERRQLRAATQTMLAS
jgi:hypothetical protein